MFSDYDKCMLCPRRCQVNRNNGETGICGQTNIIKAARASLHFWEEPVISGKNGSGTVFFSGCSLNCIYCQNYRLSKENRGIEISQERLAQVFLELEDKGAHNINLVTAEHFAPSICVALCIAKEKGLKIPIILNSSGYTSISTLKKLKKYIDIYLVDFKYYADDIARKLSNVNDYYAVADKAIEEMVRQQPKLIYDEDGMLKKGVIVRHLCLPGNVKDSKIILKKLFEKYGNNICYSIMSQFTPTDNTKNFPPLNRKLKDREYEEVIDFCIALGMDNAFIQEGDSASESFIPEFDGEGIIKY